MASQSGDIGAASGKKADEVAKVEEEKPIEEVEDVPDPDEDDLDDLDGKYIRRTLNLRNYMLTPR